MWRAPILHRLSQNRLEPVPERNEPEMFRVLRASVRGIRKYGTKVCGSELVTGGVW